MILVAVMLFGLVVKAQPSRVDKLTTWTPNTTVLVSPNQEFRLVYQQDGDLVVYDKSNKPLWNTHTSGKTPDKLSFYGGALTLYGANRKCFWASLSTGGNSLRIDNKGSLSIWNNEKVVWKSEDQTAPYSVEEELKFMTLKELVGNWRGMDICRNERYIEFTADTVIFLKKIGKTSATKMTYKLSPSCTLDSMILILKYRNQRGAISTLHLRIWRSMKAFERSSSSLSALKCKFLEQATPVSGEVDDDIFELKDFRSGKKVPAEFNVERYSPPAYKIGDRGPEGGWIFYVKDDYSDGWRYLEVAPEDLGEYKWGWYKPLPLNVKNANKTALGTGKENMDEICRAFLPMCDRFYTVGAVECSRYRQGGWYLPTIDELNLMYVNLVQNLNTGNFNKKSMYWSSTISSNITCARCVDFKSGRSTSTGIEGSLRVRPIHKF